MDAVDPVYFASPAEFREWLAIRGESESALWIGYWKKGSGRTGITYKEALDEALCYGWIDGQVKSIDDGSYSQRWTPRKKGSTWSKVNIAHMERLIAAGRVAPVGMAAFEARTAENSGIYSFEQGELAFSTGQEAAFRADPAAWAFWQKQPASYTKAAMWWVLSAKQEATRARRMAQLIADCGDGKRISQFVSPARRKGSTGNDK